MTPKQTIRLEAIRAVAEAVRGRVAIGERSITELATEIAAFIEGDDNAGTPGKPGPADTGGKTPRRPATKASQGPGPSRGPSGETTKKENERK